MPGAMPGLPIAVAMSAAYFSMDNLQYIHEQLCYAENQRELADDMYSMQAWDQRIDALQCAYNFIADQGVSKEARESVPQVLTVTYN